VGHACALYQIAVYITVTCALVQPHHFFKERLKVPPLLSSLLHLSEQQPTGTILIVTMSKENLEDINQKTLAVDICAIVSDEG